MFGLGQIATGLVAVGQVAFGVYVLAQSGAGVHVWDADNVDRAARAFLSCAGCNRNFGWQRRRNQVVNLRAGYLDLDEFAHRARAL